MKLGKALNIKGAVLDKYQLENYLEKSASEHNLQDKSEKRTYPIPRMQENFKFITKTYDLLNQHLKLGINIHPAGEWLLDNYYIIEETVKEIIQELSLKKYINFLGISGGMYVGYARIYVLASEIIAYTDGKIDSNNMSSLLKAYQKRKTLNMEEIWNINTFLKIAIIEKIRNICEKIYVAQIQKYKVENILERLIENKEKEKRKFLNLPIPENNVYLEETKYPFIEYMAFRLKRYGKKANVYIEILEEQVEKIGTTISEVIKKEHFDIAIKKVSIGNCIRSIQDLQRMNFLEIFEEINGVEEILRDDPANVYSKMDFKTKDYYRNVIKEISKKTKISEIYIAKKALELAKNNKNKEKEAHIGYYLIADGKNELMQKLQIKTQKNNNKKTAKYILAIYLISMILSIIFEYTVFIKTEKLVLSIILTILTFIPITEIVIQIMQYILGKFIKPKLIPKLDFEKGIPEEYRTAVVIPTIIKDGKKVKELFSKLEVFYLANKSENMYFILLGDCTSSKKQSESYDREIIQAGKEEIIRLNEKYKDDVFGKFQFVYRKRVWSNSEESYLGWERKRGLLTQFNEYLVNNKNEFLANTIAEENKNFPKIKYIITLDADTDLSLNSGLELIGAMAHILNKPILNKEKTCVIDGYGIMQPRIGVNLTAKQKSLFSEIFAGNGGTDSYTNAISDTYQDNFGEGIYTGKGIYDLEIFEKILKNAIPENTVLSHDLLEGSYLRCGLTSDILLMDGYPYKYNSFMTRLHRWIRGDWQIIRWLKEKVKNKEGKYIKNPLNLLSKFKILDNLRRSLLEISVILVFLLACIFNIKAKGVVFTVIFLSILTPTILDLLNAIIFRKDGTKKQKKFNNSIGLICASILRGIISITVLPFKAYMSLNAIIKTIYRTKISQKHLLEWTTAEEAEAISKTDIWSYFKYMMIEIIFAILIFFLAYKNYFVDILSILWIISPIIMWYISRENKKEIKEISKQDKEYIIDIANKTWNYFKTYMNEENNFLPPDNYQEDRIKQIVNRTSSTNIGLGVLSIISAYDLKFISLETAIDLIEKIINTIEKLPKWNGHLYNWYNTKNLMPLIPRYISTVDSGNFVGYLYTLKGFLINVKYKDKNKIARLIQIVSKMIEETDFSVLYDSEKGIFSIGYNLEDGKLTNSYYDLLASEARQASLIAIAKRDIPAKHWNNLSRTLTVLDKYKGLVSWSGTAFEYLMPNINIPKYQGSLLDESCKFMVYSQQKYSKRLGIPWGISESAFNLKDLNSNYQYKAFGIPWLGLKRGLADEMVVSSYGCVLALQERPEFVIENLKVLENEGMNGKFGLYESIDYTPNRVPYGRKSVPVKTYMAHHQALILLSINNYINNNILQKRFMENPEIKTIDILLQENMPENVIITKERKEKIDKIRYVGYNTYLEKVYTKINENLNNYNVISNGEYTVVVDEKGNGFSKYKDIQVNRFKNTNDYAEGIYFYVKNIRTKKVWKSVYTNDAKNYKVHFTPDVDKFIRNDENITTVTKIVVAPNENVEIRKIELTNNGNEEEILEVTSVIEPILSTKEQDYAHPAFNNLFLKYNLLEDNSIFIKRNKRGAVEPIYLAVNLFSNSETIGELEYEIDKDKLYENGEIEIPKAINDSKPFSKTLGLVTEPIIAFKRTIKILPGEKVSLNLIISVSYDEKEAKDNLKIYENNENVERCFEVSKARVEEETRYLDISGGDIENFQKIFSYLLFPNPTKKLYVNKLPKVSYKQSELWKYGISGDLPILLVKIKDINDINIIKEVLKAYEFLKAKNIKIDLVILDEEENIYEKYVGEAVINEILSKQLSYMQNVSGGIFLLNANEIEDINLLLFRANIILEANKGNLKTILTDIEEEYLETIKNIGNDNIKYEINNSIDNNNFKIELNKLKYYNEYGAFSEDGKEYIIKLNKNLTPPTAWSHIIANERFGTLITNNMGGFTWSKNSRLNRLTAWSNNAVFDTPSEIIYLKDCDTGEICSLGSKPIITTNDYYIIFGFGYAKYIHSNFGIIQEDEIFVPRNESAKINIIKLKNTMPNKKKLKMIYYVKPVLGEDEIKTNGYIDLQFNKNSNIIFLNNLYGEEFSKIFYVSSSEKIISYTGSKKEFIGQGTITNPDGVKKVILAEENSLGQDGCIAIQLDIELESYESKEISLIIGEEENILEAQNIAYKYCKINNCLEELEQVKNDWNDNLSKLQVNTPSESMNIILNGWVIYQTITSRLWARSAFYQSGGALGFRDQLQDTLGLKYVFPEKMKNQIIKHSKHQFLEGDVEHWWHDETGRGIRSKFSDDLLWLVFVVEEYIETTGDNTILDEVTPYLMGEELKENEGEKYDLYLESGEKEDIYHHCIRAIERALNFGQNNLPKIGIGDWNDGLSNVGAKGRGESVWLGFFLYMVLDRFINICEKKVDLELANKYKCVKDDLKRTLNKIAWDGRWFKRAFTDDGDVLGSIVNEECKIDSISQSWSIISNVADNDKKYIAMENLENHLIDKENGIIKLLDPPFEKSKLEPGYIKSYLPGVRENGGQYTHAAVWTIIAECMLGFGDKAYEFFRMINPIEHSKTMEQANKYKVEPYVIAADIYGAGNLKGRGGWTWYTGSSSWYYKAGIEYILGLKIKNNILTIEPCIPKDWKEYSIQYKYKSSTYNIKIKNENKKNTEVQKFIVNGEEIKEKNIALQDNGKVYNIEVYM